jgi:hypothetical protein
MTCDQCGEDHGPAYIRDEKWSLGGLVKKIRLYLCEKCHLHREAQTPSEVIETTLRLGWK